MKLAGLVVLAGLAVPATVAADTFTPVQMTLGIPSVVRSDRAFTVRMAVSADAGALDARQGALRAAIKLTSGECGGTFAGTSGPALLDRAFAPQPSAGRTFRGAVSGSARVRTYGSYTVCAYLDDDYEQLATDVGSLTVDVSRTCTRAADTYDRSVHDRHASPARRAALKRAARRACGSGVAL